MKIFKTKENFMEMLKKFVMPFRKQHDIGKYSNNSINNGLHLGYVAIDFQPTKNR